MSPEIKLVLAILVTGVFMLQAAKGGRTFLRQKRIPKMTTDELKALFSERRNAEVFNLALQELNTRGEDVSCAFPAFLDLALSGNFVLEIVGKYSLKTHFRDALPDDVNLDERRLSVSTKSSLQTVQQELGALTTDCL